MQLILKKRKFPDKSLRFAPIFLTQHQDLLDTIAELVNSYEMNLGTRNIDFYDDEHFINKFNDIRILKGINSILTKFFYIYKIKESKFHITPSDIRIKLYNYYIKEGLSFILPKNKDNFFQNFSEFIGTTIHDLKNNLFLDHSLFKILSRKNEKEAEIDPPLPKEVIKLFNSEMIRSLVNRSYWFEFLFNSNLIDGTKFKSLIFLTKRLGLYYEAFRIDDNYAKIKILGPQELVGRSTKYGRKLNSLLLKNIDFFVKNRLLVDLLINFYGQKREVRIDFSLIENLLNIDEYETEYLDEVFDSKVEEKFNNMFKALDKKWEITREPVIIENGIIMIPDFKLSYKNTIIFVEIVGFWTEKYLNHKVRKVRLLESKYENMILFVDENLNFPKTKLKTFYYGKEMHISSFINYLKDKYEKPIVKQYIDNIVRKKERLIKAIIEIMEANTVLSFNHLLTKIPELIDLEILKELLNSKFFLNEKTNFVFAINSQKIFQFRALLRLQSKLKEIAQIETIWLFEDLFQELSTDQYYKDQNEYRIALKISGCNWKIKNLVNEYVLFPEKWPKLSSFTPVLNL